MNQRTKWPPANFLVKSPEVSFMEKKFTSSKLILSELEPDKDLDSFKKFQTSDFYLEN